MGISNHLLENEVLMLITLHHFGSQGASTSSRREHNNKHYSYIPRLVSRYISMLTFLISFLLIIVCVLLFHSRRPRNYPPGPFSLPILGHIFPHFSNYATKGGIQRMFMDWKEKYGPIVSVDFGSFKAVVLSDVAIIKEAWNLPQITGRIQIPKVILRSSDGRGGPTRGILFTHGKSWSEQRLFMMKHLKKYGSEKLDGIIIPEAEEVILHISQLGGEPVSTGQLFNPAIINVIRRIISNDRFAHDDPDLNVVMDSITEMLQDKGVGTLVSYLPHWVVERFPGISGWDKYRDCVNVPKKFFVNLVEERIEHYKEGSTKDYIDSFITTMNTTSDVESSFYKDAGKENLIHMILDFFDSGVETTSTVMSWMILFLALHENVQKKLQDEIDEVVGKDRLPSLSDRPKMPYAEAVIQETLRKSSAVPLGLFHRSLDDVRLQSAFIPKNTIVIANLYGLHHDLAVWGNTVEDFSPERFLMSEDLGTTRHDSLAFGSGKRICPGENLAKSELFLLATVTLQKFSVAVDPNSPKPTMEQEVGGIIAPPKAHKIIFTIRNK